VSVSQGRAIIHRSLDQSDPQHYFATVEPETAPETLEVAPPPTPAPPLPPPQRRITERRVVVQPLMQPREWLLPELVESESPAHRLLFMAIAAAIVLGFLAMSLFYWAPAHPGVDQNGYLVGGRMLAEHGSTGFAPQEPYRFVGAMWVGIHLDTARPEYFPKYPIGLPVLYALCLKAGPAWAMARPYLIDLPVLRWTALWMARPDGTTLAYLLSPLCMMGALWGMFLFGRLVGGSFGGIMAMLLMGTSQVTLALMNNPNSHASDLFFVTWGMYFLARWWQTDRIWRGMLAGLLLGYAVTIRYTEGLLLLPLLIAAVSLPWRRSWLAVIPWALPVAGLVLFNLHFLGHYTGYDPTNESAGFTWHEFVSKWEFVAQEMYDNSLFLLPAIAIVGMIAIFARSWRWGFLLASWFVPGTLLYTAYYWGGNLVGPSYLRFYLTLFPPMILAAVWLTVTQARSSLAAGVVVAIAAAIGVRVALPTLERDHASNLNLAYTVNRIVATVPPTNAMLIADQAANFNVLDNALQFAGDFDLYTADAFRPPLTGNLQSDQPTPDQPARRKFLQDLFKGKSDLDLLTEAHRVMQNALNAGKPVYVVLQPAFEESFRRRYMTDGFTATMVDRWKEPADVPLEQKATPLAPAFHGFVFDWIRSAQTFEIWRITK
jgi:hypothetical protein